MVTSILLDALTMPLPSFSKTRYVPPKSAEKVLCANTNCHSLKTMLFYLQSNDSSSKLGTKTAKSTLQSPNTNKSVLLTGPIGNIHLFTTDREDTSKNNQGGLKGRTINSKETRHYSNTSNPSCCFARLYQLYMCYLLM